MATLVDAIAQAQKYIRAMDGIKKSENPPDQMSVYPYAIAYPAAGDLAISPAGDCKGLHQIVIELHAERKDLAKAIETLLPYGETIPSLLFDKLLHDDKWQHTVDTFGKITYTFGPLDYNGIATIGFKFTIHDVKVTRAIP